MKNNFFFSAILVIVVAYLSCKRDFPNEEISISEFNVSSCKGRIEINKGSFTEYITVKAVDNYYLKFCHVNSMFNCSPGLITVSFEFDSDSIIIDENESQAGERCICPYDLQFTLGPLNHGTYKIEFQKARVKFKDFLLEFSPSTDITIDIK